MAEIQHTPGAARAAEIIVGGRGRRHESGIQTEYGFKTTEGIADLIDRETAAPELLEALIGLYGAASDLLIAVQIGASMGSELIALHETRDAALGPITKAEGK